MATFLVVDDEPDMRASLRLFLKTKGCEVLEASHSREALAILDKHQLDAVLLDLFLKNENGMNLLSQIKKSDADLPIIVLTGHADVATAVEAMKLGASDYLPKPFKNEDLWIILQKSLRLRELSLEVEALRHQIKRKNYPFGVVLGPSPAMKKTVQQAQKIAPTDLSVILQGPSGSGKEVLAHLIHDYSPRKSGPFVAVDCGTLPETLVESELFGFEKGAFTGADHKKAGLFETAYRGTLFLDEVGNLSPGVQAKLLRVLQERKIRHLGGKKDIPVDVRILAASNKNLAEAIQKREFREDLYHRLNEFLIQIPPLRERSQDIPALAAQLLKEANHALHKKVQGISEEALARLKSYPWPGNTRELKNVLFRAALQAEKIISPEHIQIDASPSADPSPLKQTLKLAVAPLEKEMLQDALKKTQGNKLRAAKLLGIDRKALYTKLKKHGIV